MKVLFVCARNQWRSPTAEKVFSNIPGLDVRLAGLSSKSPHKLSAKDLEWADAVFTMEREHKSRITEEFRDKVELPEIQVLDIPDNYEYMNPELVRTFEEEVRPIIEELLSKNS